MRTNLVEYDIVELEWDNPAGVSMEGLYVEVKRPGVVGDDKGRVHRGRGACGHENELYGQGRGFHGYNARATVHLLRLLLHRLDENNDIHSGIETCRENKHDLVPADVPITLEVSVADAQGTEGGDVVFDISLNRAPRRVCGLLHRDKAQVGRHHVGVGQRLRNHRHRQADGRWPDYRPRSRCQRTKTKCTRATRRSRLKSASPRTWR